jgi:hypothetical protein
MPCFMKESTWGSVSQGRAMILMLISFLFHTCQRQA